MSDANITNPRSPELDRKVAPSQLFALCCTPQSQPTGFPSVYSETEMRSGGSNVDISQNRLVTKAIEATRAVSRPGPRSDEFLLARR
jgi:hypothetical protein